MMTIHFLKSLSAIISLNVLIVLKLIVCAVIFSAKFIYCNKAVKKLWNPQYFDIVSNNNPILEKDITQWSEKSLICTMHLILQFSCSFVNSLVRNKSDISLSQFIILYFNFETFRLTKVWVKTNAIFGLFSVVAFRINSFFCSKIMNFNLLYLELF